MTNEIEEINELISVGTVNGTVEIGKRVNRTEYKNKLGRLGLIHNLIAKEFKQSEQIRNHIPKNIDMAKATKERYLDDIYLERMSYLINTDDLLEEYLTI